MSFIMDSIKIILGFGNGRSCINGLSTKVSQFSSNQLYSREEALFLFELKQHLSFQVGVKLERSVLEAMALDGIVSSPLRRPHALKKQWEDLGSCSTLVQRHRFLLTAMVLLAFLCTIYIYFAVTLGARHLSCSGMTGQEKAMCQMEHVQASFSKGKLKFF